MTTTTTPKQISLLELEIVLARVPHATPATITAVTELNMNKFGMVQDVKTPNPYLDRATKRIVSNVFIGFIYANSVNNALKKEGKEADFVPSERKWGVRIPGTCLVAHKDKKYLECRFLNAVKPEYFLDGQPTTKETFSAFMPEKSSNAEHQGLSEENEVILRDYKLASIAEIKVMGEHYIVK
jgi:hypothetical protein